MRSRLQLDAMRHRVADHLQQRLLHDADDMRVEADVAALALEDDLLAQRLRRIARGALEGREQRARRDEAKLLGGGAHLAQLAIDAFVRRRDAAFDLSPPDRAALRPRPRSGRRGRTRPLGILARRRGLFGDVFGRRARAFSASAAASRSALTWRVGFGDAVEQIVDFVDIGAHDAEAFLRRRRRLAGGGRARRPRAAPASRRRGPRSRRSAAGSSRPAPAG